MHAPVLAGLRPQFRAMASAFVPESASLDEREWADAEAIVDGFLAAKPAKIQRQLALLVRALQLLALLRYGRPFTALDVARRTRFLEVLQDSPILLLRRGIWGLRTIALMGYYGREAAHAAIGYRADPRGWEVRR